MKTPYLIGLAAAPRLNGEQSVVSPSRNVARGTPKVCHTRFYNGKDDKSLITTQVRELGTYLATSTSERYYRLPGYGLKKLKYQSLGKHVYRLSGIQYSPKGSQVQFDGQRMTYKVKVTKQHLHFYKGYKNYVRKATFATMKAPTGLS